MSKQETLTIPAGKSRVLLRRRFSSVPMRYRFTAQGIQGSPPKGQLEVRGSRWVFPKAPKRSVLRQDNEVEAGFWDTFFSVIVIAENDLQVTGPKRRATSATRWILLLAFALVVVAAAIFLSQR